ncbi:hypothetical protein FA95DRAFT_1552989 [Auriscalpium vulgare]|uniref:Uncharacterized protein n=1 Tax=Auriscalpium vulgare TaxID=40419 RepID=A0ACB8SAE3_9AGAM|nr:hypothetical protein FA95DRAFT_1552989 [Auriscalpium vulgare]
MALQDDWSTVLSDHPIFSHHTSSSSFARHQVDASYLELSTSTLPSFTDAEPETSQHSPRGRRQTMIIKDAELIVAVGKELRVTALGDTKLSRSTRKTYKVLHTPNIQFEIQHMALNPSGKLLVVAGAHQVAVVVLPRPGFMRLVPATIDCKSIQVGQFFHASTTAVPVAKVDWHPWGEAGSTLMVMTIDGKLREYDISVDTEEPLQVVSFVPERRASKTFNAIDKADLEVASFTLGKGKADWGPLTVYAVTRSGDVYAVCPYLPKNASVPSSYLHALDSFVSMKQEHLAQGISEVEAAKALGPIYDYQHRYVNALLKQLPPGTVFPASSRPILVHPPNTVKSLPARQGPFLLQPSPGILDGSEGGNATDIMYLSFGGGVDDEDPNTEKLGLLLVATQDGRVDVCLDVDKVEARWESRHQKKLELPMLAVYESIDLGLIHLLSTPHPSLLELLQGNYPVILGDPIHDDTVYVYHAFGVHVLHLDRMLRSLGNALKADSRGNSLANFFAEPALTDVRPIVSTFSIERKASNPVIAVAVPNDVYLTYSIFILTSTMRIVSYGLDVRSDHSASVAVAPSDDIKASDVERFLRPTDGPAAYVSHLGTKPFDIPDLFAQPSNVRVVLADPQASKELQVTPDTLRFLGSISEQFTSRIHEVYTSYGQVHVRQELQKVEYHHQLDKLREMKALVAQLKGARQKKTEERVKALRASQVALLSRMDRVLHELTKKANPELSDNETKWFDELKRMRDDVSGAGRYDEDSLKARVQALQHEYKRLLPQLKALQERESAHKKALQESNQGLGVSQAFEFGQQFNKERMRISKIQKDIAEMATSLELSLSRPPHLREA